MMRVSNQTVKIIVLVFLIIVFIFTFLKTIIVVDDQRAFNSGKEEIWPMV